MKQNQNSHITISTEDVTDAIRSQVLFNQTLDKKNLTQNNEVKKNDLQPSNEKPVVISKKQPHRTTSNWITSSNSRFP